MSKLTVAIDARLVGGRFTGDSTYWLGLLRGLAAEDNDCEFLLYSNTERPYVVPNCANFRWIQLPTISNRIWSLVRFPLAARKAGAEVLHTQYNLSPLAGGNGVSTIHDVSFRIDPSWFRAKDRLLLNRSIPGTIRRAARILTVSQTSAKDISKYFPAAQEKITVTPLALNPLISPVIREVARGAVRTRFGIDFPYVLTVGTRWPRKNMNLAVAAMEVVAKKLNYKLVIGGKSGWGEAAVSESVIETGYVSHEDLAALYASADLYVAPSHYEGFGLTLLEAFASGTPVVCSPGGAQQEVVGDAAVVVKENDPSVWADAIVSVLDDSSKLERLREAGLRRVRDFSWNRTALLTLEAYREVAK